MIYASPELDDADSGVIDMIERQKDRLKLYTQTSPKRWLGALRRTTFARAIRGSNSIEGYNATLDDALAIVEDDNVLDEQIETRMAIIGYRNALTYIFQAAADPYFEFSKQFLKSLHFMMTNYDMNKYPGQWRPGSIYIVDQPSGRAVYEGPDAEIVNDLVEELVEYLKLKTHEPPIVKAAMAHLNLTMIHPFKDGNGRMARALQTLVIALNGTIHPIFSSIEEWLGRNTQEYYNILSITGQGTWNPSRSAKDWVRFCLTAHYQQAATLIRRNEEYTKLYEKIHDLIERNGLPERCIMSVFNAALGFKITNQRYRQDSEVSELVASRDLKKLSDAEILFPIGEKRGRIYRASHDMLQLRNSTRLRKILENPYDLIARKLQSADEFVSPRLPGI